MSSIAPGASFTELTDPPAVDYRCWLCNTSDMSQIAELNIHQKQLQVQLDNQGKFTGWIHLLDDETEAVVEHQTSLRIDRNQETIWSGEIFQANESSQASSGQNEGQDELQITALGWYQIFNQRLLHTGAEFQAMLYVNGVDGSDGLMPNYTAWQTQNGSYVQVGIDTAVQLAYDATEFPTTTDASIIFDLLNRANIDSPTLITPGNVYGSPIQRNLTLQRFQNVGQQITQLVNVESGVDFVIDPLTRKMDLYGPGASQSPTVPNGVGVDRGQNVIFTYPGNCVAATRSRDGTQTANRIEAIGQYGVGRADDLDSQQSNGLFEGQDSLSEVVDPNILAAYANAEVVVRKNPWTIITFTPRAVMFDDETIAGVPRPFQDYNLGDLVYCTVNRGPRFQIGTGGAPQQVRVFGFTVSVDDNGVERVSQIQTTYQGLGAST